MITDGRSDAGWRALAACDWGTARAHFEQAVADEPTASGTHGLGLALYWSGDYQQALDTLESAYVRYRHDDDALAAGRIATQLALLHWLVHGDGASASGWHRHAERALAGREECAEAGWLAVLRAGFTGDPRERGQHAEAAVDLGRRFGDLGLEYDGLAYLGKSLVERGEVERGMPLIDEALAAVASGLVDDPWATAEILCTLFHTCELAYDLRRAEEWLEEVDRHVARTGELPVFGICRMHYGGLLTSAGRWADAERELNAAIAVYDAGYTGTRFEPLLRLADLRVRQGRPEEAERLLEGYEDLPLAALPRARQHLARGEPAVASAVLERHLGRRGRGTVSAGAMALLAEAAIASGRLDEAGALADELTALAATGRHPAVAGLAALSTARVAVARGDPDTAVGSYEDALASFAGAHLPWELARSRLELARIVASERPEVARAEARAAFTCFDDLGALGEADAAAALLRELGDRGRSWSRGSGELTDRESQVLGLVAEGLTNAAIASRLHISVRTAEHHVGNILAKLELGNRAEAAAYAVRNGVQT